MPDIHDMLRRPLGLFAFESNLQADAEVIAVLDGVLNLLKKADKAMERGTPEDRARAAALLDRAEQHLERRVATTPVTAEIQQHLGGVRDLIRRHHARLEEPRTVIEVGRDRADHDRDFRSRR